MNSWFIENFENFTIKICYYSLKTSFPWIYIISTHHILLPLNYSSLLVKATPFVWSLIISRKLCILLKKLHFICPSLKICKIVTCNYFTFYNVYIYIVYNKISLIILKSKNPVDQNIDNYRKFPLIIVDKITVDKKFPLTKF